jgi:dUTP pyrophosphatase
MGFEQQSIRFVKLHPDATMPIRASEGAAGWDFFTVGIPERIQDRFGNPIYFFHTGIAVEIPPGFFMGLYPRSSLGKKGFSLSNSVGVIDEDYRGEVMFLLRPSGTIPDDFSWDELGKRLVQGILLPYVPMVFEEVTQLSKTARQSGGYGSTGK